MQPSPAWMTKSYVTGLLFIACVSIIWAASSVLIQFIYNDSHNTFHSPFMVTYIGVSLFTLWLPTRKLVQSIQQCYNCNNNSINNSNTARNRHNLNRNNEYRTVPLQQSLSTLDVDVVATAAPTEENDPEEDAVVTRSDRNTIIISPSMSSSSWHRLGYDQVEDIVLLPEEPTHQEEEEEGNDELLFLSDTDDNNDDDNNDDGALESRPWTERDHLHAAMRIAPVWFLANWTYNASLIYTSITSSTVLASTGSLFTFLFAVWTRDETFHPIKFWGVVLGIGGCIITTFHDSTTFVVTTTATETTTTAATSDHNHTTIVPALHSTSLPPLWGDLLGLISAVGYGMYAVQTRVYCPKNEALYSMSTLLGYIGFCNLVVLSPIALYQLLSGTTELTWTVVGFLTLKGLFDNVLSDYLWLRAVILTNATTATVGLGLTIPLAFASDVVLGKQGVLRPEQVLGAVAVLVGFVLVNIGNYSNNRNSIDNEPQQMQYVESSNGESGTSMDVIGHTPSSSSSYRDDNSLPRGQEIVHVRPTT
jgi:solute carrier family 35, member F5